MLVLILILSAIALTYYYLTSTFSYWKDKGVKYVKPYPLFGSVLNLMLFREHSQDFIQRIYKEFEDDSFVGIFQGRTPALLVLDPQLAKHIFVKDFAHFTDHGTKFDEEVDPLDARNLFNMQGQRWREMRAKLTPTFTSGRMKAMFPLVAECAMQLEKFFEDVANADEEFDVKDVMGRYMTDVIGSCAFGIKCNSLNDPNCEFRKMGKKLIEISFYRALKMMMIFFLPEIASKLKIASSDESVNNFFRGMVRDVIALRKRTGEVRKDFMQLLIEIKEKGSVAYDDDDTTNVSTSDTYQQENSSTLNLTDDDLTAQATVFFMAGFETSSSLLSFTLLELAIQPELQKKAREDIENILKKHNGELTYTALQEMKYLDSIIEESLRKYPPVPAQMRVCNKNYVIPGTKVTIEKGTMITIPSHAMQNDPRYFNNPDHFDPDRFREETRAEIKSKCIYTPFGEGPRQCIGNRFALMQSKLGLISILRKFEVLPTSRTSYPVSLDPRQFILTAQGGVWVKLVAI